MENEERKILDIYLFKCGSCQNFTDKIFKDVSRKDREILNFYALSMCISHVDYGLILYDTGYASNIYSNGIISKVYNTLNPTTVNEEDYITSKLSKYGLDKADISNIIISHAHPDHIGGLDFFNDTEVILTPAVYDTIKSPDFKSLVFNNMVKKFRNKARLLTKKTEEEVLSKYFTDVYDIFGDKSIYAIGLDGHSEGQIGLYIPEKKLFIGADSCWGEEFLDKYDKLRFLPRFVQYNYVGYVDTIKRVKRFIDENPDINIIFSHSNFKEGKYEI